ncbi:peptide/nickel transport system substrate-binding protein [Variovorax paradoxus]|uniref:ABC transporter substrate-binding protein n=1 Tax=Variovorax paradoxus TaxID=34073 RepID=UPI002784CE20|nr:ABC transporter substrate-binding protein [Variovorax paradoxus]MDP9965509.1 peptide/nickel transport system substrate-binding protein [Variovorax paradoxus]
MPYCGAAPVIQAVMAGQIDFWLRARHGVPHRPFFKWMAFLAGHMLPEAYHEKVGAARFDNKPVGSGPYQVDEFVPDSHIRLRAFKDYCCPKPAFEAVVVKFTTDPSARVAELESDRSDLTLEVPYEEAERLRARDFGASITPVSDIGMIFLANVAPMTQDKVRQALAMAMAIDKKGLAERLLKRHVTPFDTLQARSYAAYDPKRAAALMDRAGYTRALIAANPLLDPDPAWLTRPA